MKVHSKGQDNWKRLYLEIMSNFCFDLRPVSTCTYLQMAVFKQPLEACTLNDLKCFEKFSNDDQNSLMRLENTNGSQTMLTTSYWNINGNLPYLYIGVTFSKLALKKMTTDFQTRWLFLDSMLETTKIPRHFSSLSPSFPSFLPTFFLYSLPSSFLSSILLLRLMKQLVSDSMLLNAQDDFYKFNFCIKIQILVKQMLL